MQFLKLRQSTDTTSTMSSLARLTVQVFIVLLAGTCVLTSPVVIRGDTPSINQIQIASSSAEHQQNEFPFRNPVINKAKVMRILFPEKKDLLKYIISRSPSVKRQRQCYWSAISCY